jgi:hypothetical protein
MTVLSQSGVLVGASNQVTTIGPGGIVGPSGPPGPPGPSGLLFVASLSALTSLNATQLPSGTTAYVPGSGSAQGAFYELERNSIANADGVTTVSAGGGGNWLITMPGNALLLISTGTYSPRPGLVLGCKTGGGVFTINMPAMSSGMTVGVVDYDQNSFTNNITVVPPTGYKIQDPNTNMYGSLNASVQIRTNGESVSWMSDGLSRLFIA